MLDAPRQHDVSVHPPLSWRNLRKRHPDLKRDPCPLRQYPHWPQGAHGCDEPTNDVPDLIGFAVEVDTDAT